jgi:hypothetical protein
LLLRLDTQSGYVDGFLPAFLLRGLGIGLVMSATSYAVVSSMPIEKSGLASGTLTMARNIGTSLGVAIFGAVFLHSVHTNVAGDLSTLPPAEAARIESAATHFVPAGEGEVRAEVEKDIVAGFVQTAVWGVVVSALAVGAAFFIRGRRTVRDSLPAVPARAAAAGGGSG